MSDRFPDSADDPWCRPVWADLPDETQDTPAGPRTRPAAPAHTTDPALLAALAAVQDALALHEAAGYLASRGAWVQV